MMAKYVWLLLGLVVVTQALSVKKAKAVKGDEDNELQWPSQYTLQAKRMSLTDNIIEDYSIWRTSKQSRIDYNNGYVKSFVKSKTKDFKYGVKYEIHPEASVEQDVENVCNAMRGSRYRRMSPETILPDVDGFEPEVDEIMNDKECTKFVYDVKDEKTDVRSTLWATYDEADEAWVPVRYEVLEFNSWLGSKDKHEIWDFYDYSKDFSFRSVFDVEDYGCSSPEEHTLDSEGVTKRLLFLDSENDEHVDHAFKSFIGAHDRQYDADEHVLRKNIFKKSMRQVIQHNRQNKGYKLAINQFADKTPEEMTRYMGLLKRPEGKSGNVPFPYTEEKLDELSEDVPKEYDLRLLGLVSHVKNQEECGSCWTFGTTAAVEGALARINGGKLMALANQALVDCVWAFGAAGCDGGTDNAAYEWMMEYGLPTEAEYGPYTNKDGECNIKNMTKTFPIRGYVDVTPLSIGALKVALINHGPLSVSVHVTDTFSKYSSGIFYDTECNQLHLNHEVTLVGYGERDGDTFWILKNSWGPQWGIGGYMYISARDNICGVATEPTYVVF
ncbi:pro-cathepsin H-like isoform X2 [Spodoptera litura]|uniref:Pro-cathepsin H-like isoform X2 n=1 Tax=Spodoptera litura TaxID=69820 RepID=A0A9J7DYY3_SPOLT|nr:pro-cathepsin H-like isoform X2 [Spodoptera litura]